MTSNRFNNIGQKLYQGLMRFVLLLFFAFMVALIFFHPANAQTHSAVLHTVSYHFDRSQNWNEQNYGIGYRYQHNNHWSFQGGFYDNSYGRWTRYAVVQHEWRIFGIQAGAFAGFVTGYNTPVAAGLMASSKHFTLRLVPPVGSQTSGVIAFELTKAF
jgi:hypothetical protein